MTTSLDQQFNKFPGGFSQIPISNSRMNIAFCDDELTHKLRRILQNHTTWVKSYSQECNQPGIGNKEAKKAIVHKLLAINSEIGNSIESRLQNGLGKQLIGYLKDYIADLVKICESVAVGSTQKKIILVNKLKYHSKRITRHLNAVNQRFLPFHEIEPVFNDLIDSTVASIEARSRQDYTGEIRHHEDSVGFSLRLADLLANSVNKALSNPSSVV